MPEKKTLFLKFEEALDAIRADFSQYPTQKQLLMEICRIVLKTDKVFQKDTREAGVWLAASRTGRMRFVAFEDLGRYLCDTLEKKSPEPDILASICGRVFRTKAYPDRDEHTGREGVRIETGEENFVCQQCGRCCRTLDFHAECTAADYNRWISLGRTDILSWVMPVRKDGVVVSCRMWIHPGTRRYVEGCPWLKKISEKNRFDCQIHDVRPEICRQYPGSRKHAEMTGCRGFHHKNNLRKIDGV